MDLSSLLEKINDDDNEFNEIIFEQEPLSVVFTNNTQNNTFIEKKEKTKKLNFKEKEQEVFNNIFENYHKNMFINIYNKIRLAKISNVNIKPILLNTFELLNCYYTNLDKGDCNNNVTNKDEKISYKFDKISSFKYSESDIYFHSIFEVKKRIDDNIKISVNLPLKFKLNKKYSKLICSILSCDILYTAKESLSMKLINDSEIPIKINKLNQKYCKINKVFDPENKNDLSMKFLLENNVKEIDQIRLFLNDIIFRSENNQNYLEISQGYTRIHQLKDPKTFNCQSCSNEYHDKIIRIYFYNNNHGCRIHLCENCFYNSLSYNSPLPCLSCKKFNIIYSKIKILQEGRKYPK